MTFDVGALVKARGREWVVQPGSTDACYLLRPLGGEDDRIAGILSALEPLEPAEFPLPDPATHQGNHQACSLLRDALRLGFRSGAGPFRALARVAVEPRPYQLVPLLLALKMNPVRLLIADDVGVGKTVEACLIAREMFDRAEIDRLAVLCPPHLAEQWQRALRDQFHMEAQLVLASTAAALETDGVSLFERHRFTVVSTDYIKSERRRLEFLRTCPEMVIVDEAHTCAAGGRASQRRHELLRQLTDPQREGAPERHLVLVTATPHSGNDDAFRSLLGLLDRDLDDLPENLEGPRNERHRNRLAKHFVQRRRGDIKAYLGSDIFPERIAAGETYALSSPYKKLLEEVITYCHARVLDPTVDRRKRRIRWWSTLALLRALSSSPAAAAATLRKRSGVADEENEQLIDEEGRRVVLDPAESGTESNDLTLGGRTDDGDDSLLVFAERADALCGTADKKRKGLTDRVLALLKEGFQPIIFCRFISTVDYLVDHLRSRLGKKGVEVAGVTGQLPPTERETRIDLLGEAAQRVLVCTDCLSEGINLQQHFNAVIHYDLAWNPTRHEQREGRVDRYGQPSPEVRILTYRGEDNPVDDAVVKVLLRKHDTIKRRLGVSVFTAVTPEQVQSALMDAIFGRSDMVRQLDLFTYDPLDGDTPEENDLSWERDAERQKRSRTKYAQLAMLKAVNEEVGRELDAVRLSQGDNQTVRAFMERALPYLGVGFRRPKGAADDTRRVADFSAAPQAVIDAVGRDDSFPVVFEPGFHRKAELLTRTHPVVDGLARFLLEDALDPQGSGPARRCGVIRTDQVTIRTTLLLLRLRFHIVTQDRARQNRPLLAEDLMLAAFRGSPRRAQWLEQAEIDALFEAQPRGNVAHDLALDMLQAQMKDLHLLLPHLQERGNQRGAELLESHLRVRRAARVDVKNVSVQTHAPPDILGFYLYQSSGERS